MTGQADDAHGERLALRVKGQLEAVLPVALAKRLLGAVVLPDGREDEVDGGRGSRVVDSSRGVRDLDALGEGGVDIDLGVVKRTASEPRRQDNTVTLRSLGEPCRSRHRLGKENARSARAGQERGRQLGSLLEMVLTDSGSHEMNSLSS